jgi:hypothetical protein
MNVAMWVRALRVIPRISLEEYVGLSAFLKNLRYGRGLA